MCFNLIRIKSFICSCKEKSCDYVCAHIGRFKISNYYLLRKAKTDNVTPAKEAVGWAFQSYGKAYALTRVHRATAGSAPTSAVSDSGGLKPTLHSIRSIRQLLDQPIYSACQNHSLSH